MGVVNESVKGGVTAMAGFVSQGAGEPAFSDAGGSGDDAALVLAYRLAGGQGNHECLVESAGVAVADVLAPGDRIVGEPKIELTDGMGVRPLDGP